MTPLRSLLVFLLGTCFAASLRADPLSAGYDAFRRRKFELALAYFSEARAANLGAFTARAAQVRTLLELRRFPEALQEARACRQRFPDRYNAHVLLADTLFANGQDRACREIFEGLHKRFPNSAQSANSFAWVLAVSPVVSVRDGKRAVRLATAACTATKWNSGDYLDTYAAACAEAGDFENAIKFQKQALRKFDDDSTFDGVSYNRARARLAGYQAPLLSGHLKVRAS